MFPANGLHVPELVGTYPFRVTYGLSGGENDPPGNKGPVEVGCDVWIGFDAMIAEFPSFTKPETGVIKAVIEL